MTRSWLGAGEATGWPICSQTRLCWHQFRFIRRLSWDWTDDNITLSTSRWVTLYFYMYLLFQRKTNITRTPTPLRTERTHNRKRICLITMWSLKDAFYSGGENASPRPELGSKYVLEKLGFLSCPRTKTAWYRDQREGGVRDLITFSAVWLEIFFWGLSYYTTNRSFELVQSIIE